MVEDAPLAGQGLLEREFELARIGDALKGARAGVGRLVVVEAAAGLGKSALLATALEQAREHDFCALCARATELEREFPFGAVRQLLEPRLHALGARGRARVFGGAAELAKPLFEHVGQGAPSTQHDPTYATLHGLYWLTFNLAGEQPLALAVDDAQWADAPSLRFLAFLHTRLAELPLALIVALRTADEGAERAELSRLTSAPDCIVLCPRPLSRAAVAVLIDVAFGDRAPPGLAAACHEASAGNPFYLHALLRELADRGTAATAAEVQRVRALGPRAVSRAVLLRLVGLAAEAPALARALAVLGDGADITEAAMLAGLDEDRAARVADLLVRSAILKRERHLEFVHPIVRAAVYNDFAPQERHAQHARAARILAAGGAPPERLAAHLLGAAPEGDAWVSDQLRQAARSALAQGAPETATRYLRRALEEPPPPGLHAEVLLELGQAGALAGVPDSVEWLQQAIEHSGDLRVEAQAAHELGRALLYAGRPAEAVDVVTRALTRLDDADADLRARLELLVVMLAYTTLPVRRRVIDRLHSAIRSAEQSAEGPPELLAALALEGAYGPTGSAAEVAQHAARALADGRLVRELSGESPALYFATSALTMSDRGDAAEQHLDAAIAEARRRGSARGFAFASCFRGWTRYRRGNLSDAESDLRVFLSLDAELSLDIVYAFGLGTLIGVLLDRGDDEAASAVAQGVDRARCGSDGNLDQELRVACARLHLARGQPRPALDQALAVGDWERELGGSHDAWTRWRRVAVYAHAALGEREQAAALAHDAVQRAREFGAHDLLGTALHSAGLFADDESGIELLQASVAELALSDGRLDHARALIDLGAALRRAGRRQHARTPLRSGHELARACDAVALAERARDELRAAGARPHALPAEGTAALTPSERRVARMAVEGLSNPQIAQALFVSLKTVETHLGHAYRKLDIGSRAELPATLEGER